MSMMPAIRDATADDAAAIAAIYNHYVTDTVVVNGGQHDSLGLSCPSGKKAISISGDWSGTWRATATRINDDGVSGFVYGDNTSGVADTLRGYLVCATVG